MCVHCEVTRTPLWRKRQNTCSKYEITQEVPRESPAWLSSTGRGSGNAIAGVARVSLRLRARLGHMGRCSGPFVHCTYSSWAGTEARVARAVTYNHCYHHHHRFSSCG